MFWDEFRKNYSDIGLLLFRIVFGLTFLLHGLQKFGVLDGAFALPGKPQFLIAGIIEVIAGILIVIGLFTTWAAFIAAGEMAVAYLWMHLPKSWNPLANGGEAALLFCFAFLLLWLIGPGKYAVDAKIAN
jgi:putative oxidoreductase